MRKRKIRKIGGSLFIPLSKSDLQDFGLAEGDVIDIDLLAVKHEEVKEE